jgi:hypothetical protein
MNRMMFRIVDIDIRVAEVQLSPVRRLGLSRTLRSR